MRYFIALELPEINRQQIYGAQTKLKTLIPELRLTDHNKLHLTIAFVGEQPEEMKDSLIKVIKDSIAEIHPFTVDPSYIDAFPRLHNPHTFWVGVSGETQNLFFIQERIKDGLIKLGIEVDQRRYIPHIAIGKVTDASVSFNLEDELEKIMTQNQYDPIHIESMKLFESIPDLGFHTHNTLAEISLKAYPDVLY